MPIKEVILFCYGDSSKASTWSNVPYLMATHLEKRGITVNRVNIAPNAYLSAICNRLIRYRLHINGHGQNSDYRFTRTRLFQAITEHKIAKAVTQYKNADFCIFLCFDFYNRFSDIPSLVFSDWTYQILVETRRNRAIDRFDQKFINRQTEVLTKADVVLPLFSTTSDILAKTYPTANIRRIGFNVINCMSKHQPIANDIIKEKCNSDYILFIGNAQYMSGLQTLIKAISLSRHKPKLHVIGIDHITDYPDFVTLHGYLRKDNDKENALYYKLISGAKMMVNTTAGWAAYSSIVEGMFFYNPVIISPVSQFVNEFGPQIEFGRYCEPDDSHALFQSIDRILSLPESAYTELCIHAHERVKNYTWSHYADEMIDIMADTLKQRDKLHKFAH